MQSSLSDNLQRRGETPLFPQPFRATTSPAAPIEPRFRKRKKNFGEILDVLRQVDVSSGTGHSVYHDVEGGEMASHSAPHRPDSFRFTREFNNGQLRLRRAARQIVFTFLPLQCRAKD